MRVVRNIVNNNRTIVCTIHQPSAEIFLHFDELLLLKRGGSTIYYGPLGERSQTLVDYFESSASDTKKLSKGYNPATYMLEVRVCICSRNNDHRAALVRLLFWWRLLYNMFFLNHPSSAAGFIVRCAPVQYMQQSV
jgi:ABC-type multidrug transport system ATPase subunit